MSKFEKKFGKYAIRNLPLYIIGLYIVGYLIELVNPDIFQYFLFDPYYILHGQVWRIITWLIIPPEDLSIFTIIMLFLYYSLGRGLEHLWGSYRFNVYIFSGIIFTIIGSFVLYFIISIVYSPLIWTYFGLSTIISTYYINMSIFLAYAFTYPDEELLLYFIIPIKIKWFGVLYVAMLVYEVFNAFRYNALYGWTVAVLILVSLLNFIIYVVFGKNKGRFNPKQAKRRREYKQSYKQAKSPTYEGGATHKCAICGRTNLTNPELTFRYCSKCSGGKEYCEEHLFTHEHK